MSLGPVRLLVIDRFLPIDDNDDDNYDNNDNNYYYDDYDDLVFH